MIEADNFQQNNINIMVFWKTNVSVLSVSPSCDIAALRAIALKVRMHLDNDAYWRW